MKQYLHHCAILLAVLVCSVSLFGAEPAGNMIDSLMKEYQKDYSVACLTPTLCSLAGFSPPSVCEAKPIGPILELAKERFGNSRADKILVFCPDAIGHFLRPIYSGEFRSLVESSGFVAESTNVMPSKTPICFATIFTGASPKVHGIEKYERPVLKVPTLFDVFAAKAKRVAIITASNSSIDLIFRGRKVDYFSVQSNRIAFELTKIMLEKYDYDLIVCYDGGYDTSLHTSGAHSEKSKLAMRDSLDRYSELVKLVDRFWKSYNRVTVFAPDHGGHDTGIGKGGHGDNIPDDILVDHYYRLRAAEK